MSTTPVIQTEALHYHFSPDVKTLDNINLTVERGSVYGFLGPNGAGKTTTLRLLLGLLRNQQGSIRIFGEDIATNRISILRKVGSLIEQPSLYGHLTARENLEVYRRIYGADKSRIEATLALVDLSGTGSKKAKQFSLGMKQRLSIAVALLHRPELLILDEPTNGLDPNGIIETRELIKKLNRDEGVTIIVSSHILAEIEKMATHVGIIHKGRLLFQGTQPELQHLQEKESIVQIDTSDNRAAQGLLQQYSAVERNGCVELACADRTDVAAINRTLVAGGIDVYRLQPRQNDLEQLFLDITSGNQ
ncbi:MAG: transporter ATPase [Flaviaesturariibacter sp.]|nr:transporter ATPase [Flaviaesturariibacter sp.]